MIRDAMGNELEIGALVFMCVNNVWLRARILRMKEGGTMIRQANQQGVTPDILTVEFDLIATDAAPGQPHGSLLRLVEPDRECLTPKDKMA